MQRRILKRQEERRDNEESIEDKKIQGTFDYPRIEEKVPEKQTEKGEQSGNPEYPP